MKWIPITKEEDCPEKDSSEEYPKQYILRCKNDGGRGDYEVFKVTADEMWLTALGFDYFEYLDEQDEGWSFDEDQVKDAMKYAADNNLLFTKTEEQIDRLYDGWLKTLYPQPPATKD